MLASSLLIFLLSYSSPKFLFDSFLKFHFFDKVLIFCLVCFLSSLNCLSVFFASRWVFSELQSWILYHLITYICVFKFVVWSFSMFFLSCLVTLVIHGIWWISSLSRHQYIWMTFLWQIDVFLLLSSRWRWIISFLAFLHLRLFRSQDGGKGLCSLEGGCLPCDLVASDTAQGNIVSTGSPSPWNPSAAFHSYMLPSV